jgi:hypothetical protein
MATSKRTPRRPGSARPENGAGATADTAATPAAPKARTRKPRATASAARALNMEDRHSSIARAAYFRSQNRGFLPGFELEDWLAAEAEVDRRLGRDERVT